MADSVAARAVAAEQGGVAFGGAGPASAVAELARALAAHGIGPLSLGLDGPWVVQPFTSRPTGTGVRRADDAGSMADGPTAPMRLHVGTYARHRERVGKVMDLAETSVTLRPRSGGQEWTAPIEDVEPLALSTALRPLLGEINDRSARGRG